MAFDSDSFLDDVKDQIATFAQEQVTDYVNDAKADGVALVTAMKANLETWTEQLLTGQLTKDDYEFLVGGQQDLAEMAALTQAGLTKQRIQTIRDGIIHIIVQAAFAALPG